MLIWTWEARILVLVLENEFPATESTMGVYDGGQMDMRWNLCKGPALFSQER
jgi:hypothetical protein